MRIRRLLIPFMAAALGVSCAGQEAADTAFEEAERAITEQHTQALRYAPDAFKQVMAAYDSARRLYAAGDYRGAAAGAKATMKLTEQLGPVIGAGRRAMRAEWETIAAEADSMLTSLEAGVRALDAGAGRLPRGVTSADVTRAKEQLPTLRRSLDEAGSLLREGKLSEAVHVASGVRSEIASLRENLGMQAERGSRP